MQHVRFVEYGGRIEPRHFLDHAPWPHDATRILEDDAAAELHVRFPGVFEIRPVKSGNGRKEKTS